MNSFLSGNIMLPSWHCSSDCVSNISLKMISLKGWWYVYWQEVEMWVEIHAPQLSEFRISVSAQWSLWVLKYQLRRFLQLLTPLSTSDFHLTMKLYNIFWSFPWCTSQLSKFHYSKHVMWSVKHMLLVSRDIYFATENYYHVHRDGCHNYNECA